MGRLERGIMTLAELIEKLENIRSQNADNVKVFTTDVYGYNWEVKEVSIRDNLEEVGTGKKVIGVTIGDRA